MTYIEDLTPCSYLDEEGDYGLVAVGWLSRTHAFQRGAVPPRFRKRLTALLIWPYCPTAYLGSHTCEFCAPVGPQPDDRRYPSGTANLLVPGNNVIYACPELIGHYIDAHDYRPPDEFVAAVLECPPTKSVQYFRRLLDIEAGNWLARHAGK